MSYASLARYNSNIKCKIFLYFCIACMDVNCGFLVMILLITRLFHGGNALVGSLQYSLLFASAPVSVSVYHWLTRSVDDRFISFNRVS